MIDNKSTCVTTSLYLPLHVENASFTLSKLCVLSEACMASCKLHTSNTASLAAANSAKENSNSAAKRLSDGEWSALYRISPRIRVRVGVSIGVRISHRGLFLDMAEWSADVLSVSI